MGSREVRPCVSYCAPDPQVQETILVFFNQAFFGIAKVAILADDNMIQNPNLQNNPHEDQVSGQLIIGRAGGRVT